MPTLSCRGPLSPRYTRTSAVDGFARSRWTTYTGDGVVRLASSRLIDIDFGSTLSIRLRAPENPYGAGHSGQLECWQLDHNTSILDADITEDVHVKMAPRYDIFDENRVSLIMRLLNSLCDLRQILNNLAKHDLQTSKRNWVQTKSNSGFVHLYLLGVRCHLSLPFISTTLCRSQKTSQC